MGDKVPCHWDILQLKSKTLHSNLELPASWLLHIANLILQTNSRVQQCLFKCSKRNTTQNKKTSQGAWNYATTLWHLKINLQSASIWVSAEKKFESLCSVLHEKSIAFWVKDEVSCLLLKYESMGLVDKVLAYFDQIGNARLINSFYIIIKELQHPWIKRCPMEHGSTSQPCGI